MGTRACIAKPDGDGWIGRYHHWDGYPTGLGLTLITAKDRFFGGDLDAMIAKLIDGELVGWSTIKGHDLTKPAEWYERDPKAPINYDFDAEREAERKRGPQSYSARGEVPFHKDDPTGDWIRSTDTEVAGAEWVYVLTPDGVMVWEGNVGFFGMGGGNFRGRELIAWNDVAAMTALEQSDEDDDDDQS